MALEQLQTWLDVLGYAATGPALHRQNDVISSSHPFSVELNDLLSDTGQIGAQAVFEVQGHPTVAFFDDDGSLMSSREQFNRIRQRIWNQNLISIVIVTKNTEIVAFPLARKIAPASLALSGASEHGPFSAADVRSGEVQQRLPKWFKPEVKVDRQLLRSLKETVLLLEKLGHSREVAQTLMGQVLFISYLEHRNIVSCTYRKKRRVTSFLELVQERDIKGIGKLISCLRKDFNGDFLSIDPEYGELWDQANDATFPVLHDFLCRVDPISGQKDFWNYDFSFIPVELLSGIYESFIGDEKHEMGAYYTPRQLANLVVELAFSSSADPLKEYIYDGACGSGILLTTAFRRLVGLAEARRGTQMMLRDRIELLKEHIFGSDLNKMACKVTAFSLYLSLLENLKPSDVLALQENESVKLPTLQNSNLYSGVEKGDFFSSMNPLVTKRRFTLLISNPPWREPTRTEHTSADAWAESVVGVTRSRRQMAGDFAFRAADCLVDDGRMCLIMPASLFLAPTSQEFVRGWLLKNKVHQIINFGDLMNFIFETAEHSCIVVSASPRSIPNRGIPPEEMFDYCAPKADTSIAFGRLTLASGDRHWIQAQAYSSDCTRLVTFMWGNEADLALLRRLQWSGTFRQMMAGPFARWVRRKGFHREDASVEIPASSEPLRDQLFIEIDALKRGLPLVLTADLVEFPPEISEVAKLSDALLDVFRGPRIVFPDGFDRELEIRACFINAPASFTSSIGVISGPEEDADLLQFTAVYLRSDLIKYFLIMSAYQVVCDRNRVTLSDIDNFPFLTPADHPNPKLAREILAKVAALVNGLDHANLLRPEDEFGPIRDELNTLVFDYFGLSDSERYLVKEAVLELIPSVRPRGYASLHTQIQRRTEKQQMSNYVDALRLELSDWQRELGSNQSVAVTSIASNYANAGSLGVVRVDLTGDPIGPNVSQSDADVNLVLSELRAQRLLPMEITDEFYFAADTIIWTEHVLYIIRPLIRRFWLRHTAVRDARQIVIGIHKNNSQKKVA